MSNIIFEGFIVDKYQYVSYIITLIYIYIKHINLIK